ncbi:MAG: glutamine--fructose-6-phosphate transaminase (isomerizing) [Chitinispirillaceae bacterium]|nr:glutamine--fructose-6-phosphate transaminase (isomerizing) [Chitinispirillaceae bacterium]
MCGIIGYIGNREAQAILFNCMSRLEYRGYDSCGIAIGGKNIHSIKNKGRVIELQENAPRIEGTLGIGHTRWATHGTPNAVNAHPHFDCHGKIAVVHNGIITNYLQLIRKLKNKGHEFVSETDSELIPHLIEEYYCGDLQDAVEKALDEIEGTLAIIVLKEDIEELIASRRNSPLVIGIAENEVFVASDVPAIVEFTNKIVYLEDGDTARISKDKIRIKRNEVTITPVINEINVTKTEIEKNGFDHFMLKEIREEPEIIEQSLDMLTNEKNIDEYRQVIREVSDISIIGCGTSYHAGLVGKYIIEEALGIPVRVELASELNHRHRMIIPDLTIAITQSGETADVLVPLKKLHQCQAHTTVITNVYGSTASRISDSVLYTHAGPEISVAATKTFIAQLLELYKITFYSSIIDTDSRMYAHKELMCISEKVKQMLENDVQFQRCGEFLSEHNEVFFIGRGINFPIALEGALKLKEISYIHAEGYAGGEIKHGPFALLDENTPVIALLTRDGTRDAMISNIKEIQARKSPVIVISDSQDKDIDGITDAVITVPQVPYLFSPIVNTIAVQLIAYYGAKFKGCPIDNPRNLAKTVTVE